MGKIYNEDLHNLCWHDYVKVDVDSGHEDHSLLGYDALFVGNSLQAFWKDLPVSICRVLLLPSPPLLLLLLLTAIELSLGRSSPYTSIDKTNKNKYTKTKQYEKHSKYKYLYYQNTHTLQNQHIHTPTLYKTS